MAGFGVWNLNQTPAHLWIILMAHSALASPVFLAILVELRGDAPSQAAADEHIEQASQEVRLRHHRPTPISMIDLDVVLLESQTFRVSTVEPLAYHEQFGHTQVNHLAAR